MDIYSSNNEYTVKQLIAKNGLTSTPAIFGTGEDALAIVGSCDHKVHAISIATGIVVWSYNTDDVVSSTPAIVGTDSNALVIASSEDGRAHAIWINDDTNKPGKKGTAKWTYQTGDRVTSSPAIVGTCEDTLAIVGSYDSHVHAIRIRDGTAQWIYKTGDHVISSPAIAGTGPDALVIVGSCDHHVHAIRIATGTEQWTYSTGGRVLFSPAIVGTGKDALAIVGSEDHHVHAIRIATGTEHWTYKTGDCVTCTPAIVGTGSDTRVIVCSWDNNVYAIRLSNGTKVWAYNTYNSVHTSPVIVDTGSNSIVIVCSCEDLGHSYMYVDAIWVRNGTAAWTDDIYGELSRSSPVVFGKGISAQTVFVNANGVYSIHKTTPATFRITQTNGHEVQLEGLDGSVIATLPSNWIEEDVLQAMLEAGISCFEVIVPNRTKT